MDENQDPGNVNPLLQVKTKDDDEGENAGVEFRRGEVVALGVDGVKTKLKDADDWFQVETDGRLNAKRTFDREKMTGFTVIIVAVDKANTKYDATATATIIINDVDDNPLVCQLTECQVDA